MAIRPDLFKITDRSLLTDEEINVLNEARMALLQGKTLYNSLTKDGVEHVGWAVGLGLSLLKQAQETAPTSDISIVFAINYSSEYGYGVAFIVGEKEEDT